MYTFNSSNGEMVSPGKEGKIMEKHFFGIHSCTTAHECWVMWEVFGLAVVCDADDQTAYSEDDEE